MGREDDCGKGACLLERLKVLVSPSEISSLVPPSAGGLSVAARHGPGP